LKLRTEAVALLTLAPNICKDKLMQAAGRLRKLGRNQKLEIVGGSDVFSKLRDLSNKGNVVSKLRHSFFNSSNFTATNVLSWVMKNTVESNVVGLSNWADQGIFYASTHKKKPSLCITDETLELGDFYGKSFEKVTITDIVDSSLDFHMNRTGGLEELNDDMNAIVGKIRERVRAYGKDFYLLATGCDEECEREMELEIEREEECEVEMPSMKPSNEKRWNFISLFTSYSPKQLPIYVHSLKEFVRDFIKPANLARVNWSDNIYCTENFANTIANWSGNSNCLNGYLRAVDFIVGFPSDDILLVSEYEANDLLKLFWDPTSNTGHTIQNFCFLRRSMDNSCEVLLLCPTRRNVDDSNALPWQPRRFNHIETVTDDQSMASLQLFSGDATYSTSMRKDALKSVLRVKKEGEDDDYCPKTQAEELLEMRGKEKTFFYSDLEKICVALLCEPGNDAKN